MARFPAPPTPDDLRARLPAEIREIQPGYVVHRVYNRGGGFPAAWGSFRFFGPVDCRFDHHGDPPGAHAEGILYGAPDPVTFLAEAFQQTGIIHRTRDEPYLASFETAATLRLLDLTGLWPTRAGASMALCAGARAIARQWSRAIYLAYPDVQGLLYCSAMHGNAHSLALYERARPAVPAAPNSDVPLASATVETLVVGTATALNYGLLGS